MVSVTRQDITPGYQVVQTAHAIADFIHEHPAISKQWKEESNSIITLATKDEQSLTDLYNRLKEVTPHVTAFYEPDVQNEMTAIAVYATPEIRKKFFSNLPLALKQVKQYDNK